MEDCEIFRHLQHRGVYIYFVPKLGELSSCGKNSVCGNEILVGARLFKKLLPTGHTPGAAILRSRRDVILGSLVTDLLE